MVKNWTEVFVKYKNFSPGSFCINVCKLFRKSRIYCSGLEVLESIADDDKRCFSVTTIGFSAVVTPNTYFNQVRLGCNRKHYVSSLLRTVLQEGL